ncbi:MAG: hypothetical protein LUQ61_03865 [Methanoregulaceae archaeon]|jgi:Prokaryotic RING finger family 2|nr:hypothetical protein [Methanoregulaceae archaeon]
MRWRKSSASEQNKGKGQPDLFSHIKKDIPVLRQQGAPPEKDPGTFSRYQCDLCNGSFSLTGLKQCTLCGRWACPDCWTDEFYICRSCNGIVRLHLLSQQQQKGKARE